MICPKCGGRRFIAAATVIQTWIVDECGEFLETENECCEVLYDPCRSDKDVLICDACSYEAELPEFVAADEDDGWDDDGDDDDGWDDDDEI